LIGLATSGAGECAVNSAPAGSAAAPVAVAARIEQIGSVSRLTVDLSAPPAISANVLVDPNRVVIDLPEVNFQIDPATVKPQTVASGGLIKAFRFGQFAPGRSRIVIDLFGPAKIDKAEVARIADGDPSRLVVELSKTDMASFRAAAAPAAKAAPPAPSGKALGKEGGTNKDAAARPVIVIDPGHGGIDSGANGVNGTVEKSIVFDFAEALRRRLEAGGRYRIVMTRESDVFVALSDRVRIARDSAAQLLVSIHADMLAESADVTGATIYTASEKASDAEAARVADKENAADSVAGLQAETEGNEVSDILFDLTRRETRTYSRLFSRTLVNYLKGATRLNKNPERAAGFKVLKAPDIPAVLLELGYLSNEKDVRVLTAPDWRERMIGHVAQAIDAFFAPRLRPVAPADPVTGTFSSSSVMDAATGGARLSSRPLLRGAVAPAPH
jgi:N-acetylmuramoyl-L-alanine amidase